MEGLAWTLRTFDSFALAWPVALNLMICLLVAQHDFPLLLGHWLWKHARGKGDPFRRGVPGSRPTGLVIIPSLLRNEEDFTAITTTIESCAANEYPSELLIVASVDGANDNPKLFADLCAWVTKHPVPANVHVYVASSLARHGKMMAVDVGVKFVEALVERGVHAAFPELYFSIDGDGTLSRQALERLAARITTPHPITGNFRRVVSGKICIRPDLLWRGWRPFFSTEGQIFNQVAREFVVSNIARHNWKSSPMIGIPGALYVTWKDILVESPRYMGFMQSIELKDVVRWWLGFAPPLFSDSTARSMPEALTGASDDTCIAFIASIASWKNGKLSFDAPRTPLHALVRMLRGFFVERSHDYDPEARVYTYTPNTIKGLWKQRVRWNSSRFECAGRFWRSFWFHWEIGFPVNAHLMLVLQTVFDVSLYYVALPYYCLGAGHAMVGYALGYGAQLVAYSLYTFMALMMEKEYRKFWPVIFCLPLAPLYCIGINFFGCVNGVVRDVFLFGNATNFAPEHTLRNGRTERIAMLFRVRRFLAMCFRAAVYGDVPFGAFWFGWQETQWTPSGYDGWTTGQSPRSMLLPPESLETASTATVESIPTSTPLILAALVSRVPMATETADSDAPARFPTLRPRPSSFEQRPSLPASTH